MKKIKLDRHGNVLVKAIWETSKLARKRKEKCKAFKAFSAESTMKNYSLLLKKQDELASANSQAKIKHEKRITVGLNLF